MKRELRFALDIAKEAGRLLLRHFRNLKPSEISYKGRRNVVTVADRESEEFIVAAIRKEFPADAILAEEATRDSLASRRIWVVDPLDGTVNFAHGVPIFCVSVALMCEGQVELGVV
ncbi:MAG: inositol monophosphatase, partial [Planctomycetota bacterium]